MTSSNADRRLTFDVAKELCKKNGLDVDKANPAYGYLRLETPFRDGQTQYQFPLLQNQTYNGVNQSPTEQRMALQDNFVVGSKGFFLYFFSTSLQKPISELLTCVTPFNNPAGYAHGNNSSIVGAQSALLYGFNNEFWISGWMKYSMDYKVIIPRYDCLQHFMRQRTQGTYNPTTSYPFDPATDPQWPWTQENRDGLSDGFMPMEPNIVLSGAKNTEINYNLPFSLTFADLRWDYEGSGLVDGTIEARLCCIYRGVLLQNTTNVR